MKTKVQTNPGTDQDPAQIKEALVRALEGGVAGLNWRSDDIDADIKRAWSTISITIASFVAKSGTFPNLSSEDLHPILSKFINSL